MLIGAAHESEVVQEEQFCPLLPIVAVEDDEQAVTFANDTRFGLNAGVWSADPEHGNAVADRLRCGISIVNGTPNDTKDIRAPFGGVDQSGIGRTLADEGLRAFSFEHTRVARVQ
ncbi:MAG: hypothetical protein ABS81_10245 [Pseudonocardia sp. SCN 72-86]|nr:MAG: hypothetical protein ABS81_10245 [Pseudonocardia sp. SCN 72-86]